MTHLNVASDNVGRVEMYVDPKPSAVNTSYITQQSLVRPNGPSGKIRMECTRRMCAF